MLTKDNTSQSHPSLKPDPSRTPKSAVIYDGLCKGLDETNAFEARSAGNAVCPQVARWIAGHLMTAF